VAIVERGDRVPIVAGMRHGDRMGRAVGDGPFSHVQMAVRKKSAHGLALVTNRVGICSVRVNRRAEER
jgi:hypothetical protein